MRKQNAVVLFAMMVILATQVHSQVQVQIDSTRQSNVFLHQTNIGITGYNVDKYVPGTIWPRGSDHCFLFASGLWVGAVVEQNGERDSLVFLTYNPNSGRSWSTPASDLLHDVSNGAERFRSSFNDGNLNSYEGSAAKRQSEGFPLGLRFDQELTAFTEGAYRNCYVIRTVVTNTNASRILSNVVVGWAVDVDLGSLDKIIENMRDDRMSVLNEDHTPIIQVHDAIRPELGSMGVAFVESPGRGLTSCYVSSLTSDNGELDRYMQLTRPGLEVTNYDMDTRLILAHTPLTLGPGESVVISALFMFSSANSDDSDQEMISLVNNWKSTSDVEDDEVSRAIKVYPNPVNATDVIHINSASPLQRADLYNSLGVLVTSSVNEPTTMQVANVPAGAYVLRMVDAAGVQTARVVVIR